MDLGGGLFTVSCVGDHATCRLVQMVFKGVAGDGYLNVVFLYVVFLNFVFLNFPLIFPKSETAKLSMLQFLQRGSRPISGLLSRTSLYVESLPSPDPERINIIHI